MRKAVCQAIGRTLRRIRSVHRVLRHSVRQSSIILLPALLLLSIGARAAELDPLFASDAVLDVTLTGPLRELSRDRSEVPERRAASLAFAGSQGTTVTLPVELEPRGKSRRDRDVCTFPPLWLRFDKDTVKGTLFAKQKRLKMVTYCRSPQSFQDYVLKEYLAYRIFNQLSDVSFRVRLLRVHFAEEGSTRDPLVRYGFFIEHKKRLSKRLDAEVVEPEDRIPPAALEPVQASIAELFQYMVSNTDFSFIAPPVDDTCCHNAILLAPEGEASEDADADAGPFLAVPYDFDRTGFVDPPNGEPALELGQRSFRDRVYRGFCRPPGYLETAIDKTLSARGAIETLIQEQEGLSDRSRSQALRYLAGYYEVIDDPGRRERALNCRDVH